MKIKYNFEEVVKNFNFEGKFIEAKPYGDGHINDSFQAIFENTDGSRHRYLIQRINSNIFKSPEQLMENIENVTLHLKKKLVEVGGDVNRETLNLIETREGKYYYISPENDYWRSYIFIEKAKTYLLVENPNHFYNAGKAFGRFQQLLADFPAINLHETIPDFHNTNKRFKDFLEAVKQDKMHKAKEVQAEIDFVLEREEDTKVLVDLIKEGKLPIKVTHNDTKFNNVMIDDVTGEGICVIDLDTVMPGLSLYDFGDSIRSGTNTAEEDEPDVSKVWMDLNLFESFTKGFLETAGHSLTSLELEYLPFSAKLMTLECGMRFLGDHLNGDTYFKIHRNNHNLDRARSQFKMVADIETKLKEMKLIVEKYI